MKRFLLFVISFIFCWFSYAETITSKGVSGDWNDGNSWVGGVAPTLHPLINIVIVSGANITLNDNYAIGTVTIDVGGTLNLSSYMLTIWLTDLVVNGTLNASEGTLKFGPGLFFAQSVAGALI